MQYSIIRYCSSSVTTQRATRARDNVAVVGTRVSLNWIVLRKNYLRQLNRYTYTMRTLRIAGFLYKGIQKY